MSFVDITMEKNGRKYYDLDFENGDLKTTGGFNTALKMSLMCERRASESEVPAPQNRRGWWGNEVLGFEGFEIGSKLWLLSQARQTQLTLNKTITFVQNAYQWMIDDNFLDRIEAITSYNNDRSMNLLINFIRSNNIVFSKGFKIWENTITEIPT